MVILRQSISIHKKMKILSPTFFANILMLKSGGTQEE